MRAAKCSLVLALMFVVNAGLVYSQLCDVSCAVYGCSPSEITHPATESENKGDEHDNSGCGHHKPAENQQAEQAEHHKGAGTSPTPEGHKHPSGSECPSHIDQLGTLSAGYNLASQLHQQVQGAVGVPAHTTDISPGEIASLTLTHIPDRSPPRLTNSVLRI